MNIKSTLETVNGAQLPLQIDDNDHQLSVLSLINLLQSDFSSVDTTSCQQVSKESNILNEKDAMKLLLQIVQDMQIWSTDLERLKDKFSSEIGKTNLDIMKAMAETAQKLNDEKFKKFVEQVKKQKEMQNTQKWLSIAIGVVTILGNLAIGNIPGAVVATVLLVATLPVFKDNSSLLDKLKGAMEKGLEKIGLDEKDAKLTADIMSTVLLAAIVVAGNPSAMTSSSAKALMMVAGAMLEASVTAGLIQDATLRIAEENFSTGDKVKDDERNQIISAVVTMIVMILGLVFHARASVPNSIDQEGELVSQMANTIGENNFALLRRTILSLEFLLPMANSATQTVQSSQLADNRFQQADLMKKIATISGSKEFIELLSQNMNAMVGSDRNAYETFLNMISQLTQSILQQFNIYQSEAEVLL